jgi:ubiquinone biosynthesis monooxygenase Coq7
MSSEIRRETALDRIFSLFDHALKNATGCPPCAGRPLPAPANNPDKDPKEPAERRHSAGLMRVNHAGEIAAQALYHGQALVAQDPAVREFLMQAAREEGDHLVWCAHRLHELGSRPRVLGPVWYAGSALIGAIAGIAGDAVSLGFIAETEKQVEGHIEHHLEHLPQSDQRSRAILEQMKADEIAHRDHAIERGGTELSAAVQKLMRGTAKIMTKSAYWM